MSIKEAGKDWVLIGIVVLALSFGMVGNVGAYMEIRDLGIELQDEWTGYIDYKNEVEDIFLEPDEEYNVTGVLTVYCDGNLTLEEDITLKVVSFKGFAVNVPETQYFGIYMTEGIHTLTAYIESDGETVEETYEYEIYTVKEEEEEKVEEVVDWLPCP